MANALYPVWKQSLLTLLAGRDIDVNTADDGPYVSLYDVGAGGAYDGADEFYNAAEAGQVGDDMRIVTPTVVTGTFDGDNVTFTAVSGASVEALVIFRHNAGASSTWPLVAYIDTAVTGLPVTPNGGDITVTWHGSGIFTL